MKNKLLKAFLLLWIIAIPCSLIILHMPGVERRVLSIVTEIGLIAGIEWEVASIRESGLDAEALNNAVLSVLADDTRALLLNKNDAIIYEWYAEGLDQYSRFQLAAAAKPLVGGLLLGKALEQGVLVLDQPVAEFLPAWKKDPDKSRITFRQLASHTSGMEDVPFYGISPRKHKELWRKTYERNLETRFKLAQTTVPLAVSPGTRYIYSGCGYYILSYTITRAFRQNQTMKSDLRTLYRREIMEPLGIGLANWEIGYGDSHFVDGMTLYSIGSGTSMTARAVARVAQMIKNRGRFQKRTIMQETVVEQLLRPAPVKEAQAQESGMSPITAIGWYLNTNGFFRGLPRDAIIAYGVGPQVAVISRSLNVILVRIGIPDERKLFREGDDRDLFVFLEPVFEALAGPGLNPENRESGLGNPEI